VTSEPLATKLAVLIRYLRDGRPLRGSGLRIGGRYILTADHCADGSDHRIIVAGSEFDAAVSVRSGTRDVDIAVLIAPDLPSVEPLPCARVNTTISATVEDCAALGFPEWKKASGNAILAHAPGYVPTAEGQDPTSHAGRVPLLTLKITAPQIRDIPVEAGDLDQVGSKWAGMSGAVVISREGQVLGVVRSHAPAEGVGSLTFTPLHAIDRLPAATAAALWSACGVYDPHALPVLPTSDRHRRLDGHHDELNSHHRGAEFQQLPPDIDDFTGREEQINRIAGLISAGRGKAVPIVGIFGKAGVGKTALALRVAHAVGDQFLDGQMYSNLRGVEASIVDPAVALAIFLRELGVDSADIPENTDDRARMFRARLSHRRMLIVLDNAANEAQVRPLLPWSSGCAVIVTSRVGMSALAGANLVALDVMPIATAIELLAAIIHPDGTISEPAAIREIAELCGYLPLALRIAGARLRPKPWRVTWLAERLRQENRRLNLLKIGDLEVRASFSLSYEGLTPSLQRAFRLTGALPLEFSAWALAAVTDSDVDNAEELLEHLADAQLVEINGMDSTGLLRYTLHDLLRDFARECFDETESAGARHTVLSALLDQYIAMAAVGAEILQPGAHTAPSAVVPLAAATVRSRPRQWFGVERANLISLVQTAHDAGLWERTWQLAVLLPAMFDWRADWQAWEQTQQLALTAARNASDIVAETAILCGLGSLQRELGQFDSAVAMLTKSAELGKQQSDDAWATALHHLGDTYRYQGLLNEAISTFTTAIDVFQRLHDQRSIAGCLNGRGDAQRGLSRWTESEQDIRQAIELYRSIDDPIEVARATIRYAMVFRDRSHYDKSAPLLNDALEKFRELADRRWEAQALRHFGVIRRQQGEIDTAIRLLSQCLLIFDELVDRRGIACTIRNRGDAYRWAEDYDNATVDLQQALQIFTEIGDRRWAGRTQLGLAGINRANQNWDQALSLARSALDIFTDIGDRPGQGRAWRDIGIILRDQGRSQEAVEALSWSRELYQSLGDELWVARVLTAEGRRDEAADLCRRNDIADPDTIAIVLKEW